MKVLQALAIFTLFSITALADVQISNVYYIEGSTIKNDVALHDMDYQNNVDIYRNSASFSGNGENSSGSTDSKVLDKTLVISSDGTFGSKIDISAEKIQYAKGAATGIGVVDGGNNLVSRNDIQYSYLLSTGREQASFFNGYSSVDELLLSEKNSYSAISDVTPNKISLEGYGNRFSFVDEDNSLYYNLKVKHLNLWADTTAQLVATRVNDVEVTPVVYSWNVSAGNLGNDYSTSHVDMAFIAGDRQVDAQIAGEDSNGLIVNVPASGTPWHVDPIPDGSGSNDVKTIEDLINLVKQGVSNSGYIDWKLEPN